jgi:hypothetical protein
VVSYAVQGFGNACLAQVGVDSAEAMPLCERERLWKRRLDADHAGVETCEHDNSLGQFAVVAGSRPCMATAMEPINAVS